MTKTSTTAQFGANPCSPDNAVVKPCPFCGNELYRSPRAHNPKAYCVTEDCYGKRMSVVNLDDPVCVATWNTRASLQSATATIDDVPSCGQENDYRRATVTEAQVDDIASRSPGVSKQITRKLLAAQEEATGGDAVAGDASHVRSALETATPCPQCNGTKRSVYFSEQKWDFDERSCHVCRDEAATTPDRGNYEDRHPNDMVLHPLTEIREWDEALAVLGIQDDDQTPADAIRELHDTIERMRDTLQYDRQKLQATYNDLLALQDQTDQVPLSVALDAVGLALSIPEDDAPQSADPAQRMPDRDETLRGLAEFFSESVHLVWSNDEIAHCLTEMIGQGSQLPSTTRECACMRGGYPLGNCAQCDDPNARDAAASAARDGGKYETTIRQILNEHLRDVAQTPAKPCAHEAIISLDGKWHCQRCGDAIEMAVAHSSTDRESPVGWGGHLPGKIHP